MRVHDTEVIDTFAEAFPMWGARIVVTAETPTWAEHAARSLTDVAKPVSDRPACSAQAGVSAVTTIRAPHIGNASANVSSTSASWRRITTASPRPAARARGATAR